MATFKAIVIDKGEPRQTVALADFDEGNLMDGDVTVRVEWSALNYKDGLAITGKAPVVRRFPMIPGIDFAGTIEILEPPRLEAGRSGDPQRLGLWGDASRRLWREGPRQGRLARARSREHERARGHGDRDGRLHRHARRDRARASRGHARARPRGGNRCRRRRRLGRDCNSFQVWLSGHGGHRTARGGRLPEKSGSERDHRARGYSLDRRNHWQKSAGPAASTLSARLRSPMCCR